MAICLERSFQVDIEEKHTSKVKNKEYYRSMYPMRDMSYTDDGFQFLLLADLELIIIGEACVYKKTTLF